MNMKIFTISILFDGLLAARLIQALVIAHWQDEEQEPEILIHHQDTGQNPIPFFDEKFPAHFEESMEQVKRLASPEEISVQQRLITGTFCPCETQYEMRDLGEGYYPRYLTASRCKPKACQNKFNSCRLLHYMVHILRQRDTSPKPGHLFDEENAFPESPLPDSLRRKWQMKPMPIAVACVPNIDNRRN